MHARDCFLFTRSEAAKRRNGVVGFAVPSRDLFQPLPRAVLALDFPRATFREHTSREQLPARRVPPTTPRNKRYASDFSARKSVQPCCASSRTQLQARFEHYVFGRILGKCDQPGHPFNQYLNVCVCMPRLLYGRVHLAPLCSCSAGVRNTRNTGRYRPRSFGALVLESLGQSAACTATG